MKIEKTKICDLQGVYVTSAFTASNGTPYLICASENRDQKALIIDQETLQYAPLWEGPTGVMNIVQIPNTDRLTAITKFYPIFQSKEATVNEIIPSNSDLLQTWNMREVLPLPFCHRIGIFETKGTSYLVACTLCKDKDFQEDWSKPGAVYVCKIPQTCSETWKVDLVYEGLIKNHGLYIYDKNQVFVTAENGILLFDFSDYRFGMGCNAVLVSKTPTSDIMAADIDNDGIIELCCIEPFHGDTLSLYKMHNKTVNKLFSLPLSFGHVVWLGKIYGIPAIIAANRGSEKTLELYLNTGDIANGNLWKKTVIDSGVGATQITVFEKKGIASILSANHGVGEVICYKLKK